MSIEAKKIARSLEQQIVDRYLESRKEYSTFVHRRRRGRVS